MILSDEVKIETGSCSIIIKMTKPKTIQCKPCAYAGIYNIALWNYNKLQ